MKDHLFARLCRVIGRFLLCAGGISLAGSIALVIAPYLVETDTNQIDTIHPYPTVANPPQPEASFIDYFPYIILSIVLVAFVFIALFLVMRRYNDTIRKFIGKIANLFNLSIQITELSLSVFAWGSVVLLTAFNAPVFSILALFALIINELFFIFAWTAYGGKNYTA